MREGRAEPTTRFVGVTTVVFWASAALMMVAALLSWAASGLREVWSFNLLGGTCATLTTISSALLFWQELRVNRQQMRDVRREHRDVPREDDNEWTPKMWLYATAFGISFFLAWYLVPHVLFTS